MKILIIGNGGREHALLRKLREDAPGASFFITRGNGGTSGLAEPIPLDPSDSPALAAWAAAHAIDLAVCGPEAPLAAGIRDQFMANGVPFFGPSRHAADIEASKAYAKHLMQRAGIPTAAFGTFLEYDAAARFIRERGAPIVVKASGLAAGKGAVVCETVDEALDHARAMLSGELFGGAGAEIVIEEFMQGEELSVFAITDGVVALPMLPAQDHKRIGAGETGPNTGGMGAYAPVSIATPELMERVQREILQPTLDAMREDDRPFQGLLYAGLMITADGPKVIEFNARFGDPETQVVLPMLASSLLDPMLTVARGESLRGSSLEWKRGAAVTTVLAAGGYPGTYRSGEEIAIPAQLAADPDVYVYHAGTRIEDGRLVTSGGRVLAVTGTGPDMATAARNSQRGAAAISFAGRQYREDIGWRELAREVPPPASLETDSSA